MRSGILSRIWMVMGNRVFSFGFLVLEMCEGGEELFERDVG